MKKLIIPLLALFLLSGLQSCKKKEQPPSAFDLITRDSWFQTHLKVTQDGTVTIDDNRHNKTVFAASGDYFWYNESGTDVDDFGTWKLMSDDKQFRMTSHNGSQLTFDILTLNKNKLELEFEGDSNGHHYIYNLLFQRF